jgi:signal transduction histidine kinase
MSERAAALGGRVHVGPRENGGWRVHAVLPLSGGDRR